MRHKVGSLKEKIKTIDAKTGKEATRSIPWTYKDVEYDIDGWADSQLFLPDDYDLVHMRLAREKTIPGWIAGSCWHGLRLQVNDKVLFWKRSMEDMSA